MDWIERMNSALEYIERNLPNEIDYELIAQKVYCSSYNFQRVFSFILNIPLAEYIRNRRLTLAAAELLEENARIIDVAVKYQYESQDSFSRAFYKFHGFLPSAVKANKVKIKEYPKAIINLNKTKGEIDLNKITNYSEITPEIVELTKLFAADTIAPELYTQYNVYRGLRDLNGNGVRVGLTNICDVTAKQIIDGVEHPAHGKLFYRGIEIQELVRGFMDKKRFGFEETIYLLLFGSLPNVKQLEEFKELLGFYCSLPPKFTRDVIMKAPSTDMMNTLARSVLTLYAYDDKPDDISLPNVMRQCLQLIAMFPMLAVYGYQAYAHYYGGKSLTIHQPNPNLSYAENIFTLLRHDQQYTELEARILDAALVLHAEHGGGNNSTFAIRVVTSSATDTYSAVAAALGSLKGPKHGGANIEVSHMMKDLKQNVANTTNEGLIADYLKKLLDKQGFDRSGLIYGIGHPIYSLSDPRAIVFEDFVKQLSKEKGREEDYALYAAVARIAPELIVSERKMYKGVSANIDFYSGFVYDMLGLPEELYTPIFAISRMVGWSAHRLEELHTSNRLIRPAYKSVAPLKHYVPIEDR